MALTLLSGAGLLTWRLGGKALGAASGALSLAAQAHVLPAAGVVAVLAALAALVCLTVWYLGFGRRRLLKAVLLALVVCSLAVPGAAVGYADGLVSTMSTRSATVKRVVKRTERQLKVSLPGKAVNILLLGTDTKTSGGRSDSQILVRLDPKTKTITMLSLPRDLRVDVPGVGYTKMNAAYSYGGAALAVKTFRQVTGLSINHFVCIDFTGFWHVIDDLGGVYFSVDHRYYVSQSADYKSIDVQPGYQLMHAKQALDFVRFRHDLTGDFGRMARQQLFLREIQRQSGRWDGDWRKLVRMVRTMTGETTTDLDSLKKLLPIVRLALTLNTSHIRTVRVVGSTPTIDGVSYVVAGQSTIDAAVSEFLHPGRSTGATKAATSGGTSTASLTLTKTRTDVAAWKALDARTPLDLEAPTVWTSGLAYDQFHAYGIKSTSGRRTAAAVVTGTYGTGYWSIQAMRWTDPPAIADPDAERTIGGRRYLLFSEGSHLHMVAWKENGALYWILNTLDDQISNRLLLKLAVSCRPVTAQESTASLHFSLTARR